MYVLLRSQTNNQPRYLYKHFDRYKKSIMDKVHNYTFQIIKYIIHSAKGLFLFITSNNRSTVF